jgi:hypothetical protein
LFGVNRRQLFKVRGLLACGVLAMGSVLAAPLGARALDFDWNFSEDTGEITRGTVKGLVEGFNPGGAGEIVEVVDTPLTLALGGDWIFMSSREAPFAFNVVNGVVVAADASYVRTEPSDSLSQRVAFGLFGPGHEYGDEVSVWSPSISDGTGTFLSGYPTVFFSEGSAPGDTPENPLMPVDVGNFDNSFVFNFPVQPSRTFFIDPEIAIGYDYAVSGGPLFASVTAPTGINASDIFDLVFGATNVPITGGVEYSFGTPQSSFRIQGIDLAANLDPTNPTAFVTGVSFDSSGTVNVTQTPITFNTSASVPGPIPLLGVGAAFGFSRKLRKRIKSLKLESLGVT